MLPLIEKKRGRLTRAERKLQKRALQTAQLMTKYGKASAIALVARKVKTSEVSGILEKEPKLGERFFELVLEAERKVISKRFL